MILQWLDRKLGEFFVWLFTTKKQRHARWLWKMERYAGSTGDRYIKRGDEVCLSDECVSRVREAEGR